VKGFHLDAHLVVGDTSVNATGVDTGFLIRGTLIKYLKTTQAELAATKIILMGR
jgi:hypothetical protein